MNIFKGLDSMQIDHWNYRKVQDLISTIETNSAFFDDDLSVEFCIALKMRDVKIMFQIADDLSEMYLDAKANGNHAAVETMASQYFRSYCVNNNPRGVAEFFQIFFKDDTRTTDLWGPFNEKNIILKYKVENGSISIKEEELLTNSILEFTDEVRQTRYFQNPEIYNFYFEKFISRLREFEDEYVKKSFEYFLNISIPLSEKFYASGYIQDQTEVTNLEEALNKKFSRKRSKQINYFDRSWGILSRFSKHISFVSLFRLAQSVFTEIKKDKGPQERRKRVDSLNQKMTDKIGPNPLRKLENGNYLCQNCGAEVKGVAGEVRCLKCYHTLGGVKPDYIVPLYIED